MAIRACSFARNRADSGRVSGSERYEKIAATPEGWAGSRCCRRTSGCRAVARCTGSTTSAATIRWRSGACRSRSSRSKAASSHCEPRDHRVSKGGKVLQASGKPKKFGRRDFSRRPMAWVCSTDRRAIRILGYLAGQGTPTFLWSATE